MAEQQQRNNISAVFSDLNDYKQKLVDQVNNVVNSIAREDFYEEMRSILLVNSTHHFFRSFLCLSRYETTYIYFSKRFCTHKCLVRNMFFSANIGTSAAGNLSSSELWTRLVVVRQAVSDFVSLWDEYSEVATDKYSGFADMGQVIFLLLGLLHLSRRNRKRNVTSLF
jgi:hypothetical protein